MGGTAGSMCSACQSANKAAPISVQASGSTDSAPSAPGGPGRKKSQLAAHEGQKRAILEVKAGGFSLKNFAATNPGKLEDFYKVSSKVVGEGAFGKVCVASDKRSNQARALKSISKTAASEVQKIEEELTIIALLDHPNIVRIYESFQDRRNIYILMELCDGGELFDRIVEAGSFTEAVASHCVKQMLLAVNYLHQNLIIHRDLKPENWLVASRDPVETSSLKLIDFGISKRLQSGQTTTSKAGTPNYVAPEIMNGRYNEKVDLWSTGVIMYIMLTGLQPFPGGTAEIVLQAVRRATPSYSSPTWSKISQTAKGIVKALLQKTPSARPSAAQALQHAWFNSSEQGVENFFTKLEVDNLRAFSQFHKVKKAALTVVASQLSDARIEKLKQMFLGMDRNSDGSLSVAELKNGLKAAGVKIPKDLATVLEQVDTDGSGVLDYTEFLAATIDKKIYSQESMVWSAFRKFDRDGSGTIDKAELMNVLCDDALKDEFSLVGDQEEINKIFNEIDLNGDGLIDFDEFFAMVRVAEDGARDASTCSAREDKLSRRSTSSTRSPRSLKSPKAGNIGIGSARSKRRSEQR